MWFEYVSVCFVKVGLPLVSLYFVQSNSSIQLILYGDVDITGHRVIDLFTVIELFVLELAYHAFRWIIMKKA